LVEAIEVQGKPPKWDDLPDQWQQWRADQSLDVWSINEANVLSWRGQASDIRIREPVLSAWEWATKEGVLCDSELRGVGINVFESVLNGEAVKGSSHSA
jgi:hypothetical protein